MTNETTASGIIPEVSEEQLQLARAWHGGQGSMLYAVASTGGLFRDSRRPLVWDEGFTGPITGDPDCGWRPATDREWADALVDQLVTELRSVERSADLADETTDGMTAYVWWNEIDEHWAAISKGFGIDETETQP
jgi:hypothetical protein